jgi:hypothetical protein
MTIAIAGLVGRIAVHNRFFDTGAEASRNRYQAHLGLPPTDPSGAPFDNLPPAGKWGT